MSSTYDVKQLGEDRFKEIIENNVLPLFSGASLSNIEKSSSKDSIVASCTTGGVLLKPNKESMFRIKIYRAQAFTKEDIQLLNEVVRELVKVNIIDIEQVYRNQLSINALERAISQYMIGENSEVLSSLLNMLSRWSVRTYEGGRVSFGFIIDTEEDCNYGKDNIEKLSMNKILEEDFSAVLTDGISSWLVFDKYGYLCKHEMTNSKADESTYSPLRFACLANSTTSTRIGAALLSNGEILLFKDKELKFAKRRGAWRSFHHEPLIKQFAAGSKYTSEEIRKAIYLSTLDVSFARTGGSICYLRKLTEKKLLGDKIIDDNDILSEEKSVKSTSLNKLVRGRYFQELDRKLRQELMGIDGATVINHEGKIITTGAIISISSGSTGGGRLAATKTLAKYGPAIKVSEDGMIQAYTQRDNSDTIEKIFSVG